MPKIKCIDTWIETKGLEAWTVAKVYYTTGSAKKYTNRYTDFPKTVKKYIDSHEGKQINSQCTEYREEKDEEQEDDI